MSFSNSCQSMKASYSFFFNFYFFLKSLCNEYPSKSLCELFQYLNGAVLEIHHNRLSFKVLVYNCDIRFE